MGLLRARTFLGVLAAVTGQTARPLALVAVPLAAAAAGGLILAGVPQAWAVGPAPDAWGVPALASQCLLGACCCPAEGRITVIAWRFSRRVRVGHIRWGMRAVCGCKGAPVLTVGNDAARVERMLGEGSLCCPGCGGRLARWGHARERTVFGPGRAGRAGRYGRAGPGARRAG